MRRCGIESNVSSANGNQGAATAANYLLFTIKEIGKDSSFGFCQIKNIKNSNLIRLSEYTVGESREDKSQFSIHFRRICRRRSFCRFQYRAESIRFVPR